MVNDLTHLTGDELWQLVNKYNKPGPRYTSYPTVPAWTDEFGPDDFIAALRDAGEKVDEPLSLYFHIPFCPERCLFCACNTTLTKKDSVKDEYLTRLEWEMNQVSEALGSRNKAIALHFGGGTPTYLNPDQLDRLLYGILSRFEFATGAEFSVEIDPMECTEAHMDVMYRYGLNRISMGVQDTKLKVQQAVNRVQPMENNRRIVTLARERGIEAINVDLIYGLPYQSVESFSSTVDEIMTLEPTRLAVYSFAHVPWFKKHQKALPVDELPGPEQKFAIFNAARLKLMEAGFLHVGMDHFAKPEDELCVAQEDGRLHRNFMGYTVKHADDLIAFGMSSISAVAGRFAQNDATIKGYSERIDSKVLSTVKGMLTSEDDRIRQYTIAELMCNLRLDLPEISQRFSIDAGQYLADSIAELDPLIEDGLVTREEYGYHVTPLGKLFLRNISMPFDAYLGDGPTEGKFSKTI